MNKELERERRTDLMPWARIDDAFDDHPKVLAVLEHEQGGAAIGLWTLCLTWAHRNTLKRGKTPGLISASLPRRYLGPGARDLAALLVKEGLWEPLADGDGWMIHDFDQYLPSAQTSQARSEAGRKGAASRWGQRGVDSKEPESNGNLPSDPGNEPDAGHSDDGNSIANDGSRARARRVQVVGSTGSNSRVPSPVPPSAAQPDTAQTLIAEWMDHCRKRPPERVIGQVARELGLLLNEELDVADIRRGLAAWHQAAKHPSTLASFVNEVMNGGSRRTRGGASDDLANEDYSEGGTIL